METSEFKKEDLKLWDVFQIWEHILIYWDSTKKEYLEKVLKNKKIKSIITDPPYGIDYVESKKWFYKSMEHKNIENDEIQTDEKYVDFTSKYLENVKEFLEDKNSYYIFNSDKMIFTLKDALEKEKFKFSQLLVWVKNGWVIWRLDYLPQHELIAYGWYKKHEFLRSKGKTIFHYPKTLKNTIHPTMKPVSLIRELILNSTHIGEYVYDPFLGSGTTMLASEQTKRKCIWVEFEKEYVIKIIERMEKLFSIKAHKLEL